MRAALPARVTGRLWTRPSRSRCGPSSPTVGSRSHTCDRGGCERAVPPLPSRPPSGLAAGGYQDCRPPPPPPPAGRAGVRRHFPRCCTVVALLTCHPAPPYRAVWPKWWIVFWSFSGSCWRPAPGSLRSQGTHPSPLTGTSQSSDPMGAGRTRGHRQPGEIAALCREGTARVRAEAEQRNLADGQRYLLVWGSLIIVKCSIPIERDGALL